MKKIILNIHSVVDLITNSSTELYVVAHGKTISILKDIINDVLAMGESKLKCDDIFDITFRERNRRQELYNEIDEIYDPEDRDVEYDTLNFLVISVKDGVNSALAQRMTKNLEILFDAQEFSTDE